MTTYRNLSLPKPQNVAGRVSDRLHQHLIDDLTRRLEALELAIEKVATTAEMNPWARTLLENALHYAECPEVERDEIDAGLDEVKSIVKESAEEPAPAAIAGSDDVDQPASIAANDEAEQYRPVFGNPRDIAHARGFYNEALIRLKYGGEL